MRNAAKQLEMTCSTPWLTDSEWRVSLQAVALRRAQETRAALSGYSAGIETETSEIGTWVPARRS